MDVAVHVGNEAAAATGGRVVVAGGGPVGIRVAQELSRRGVDVVLFNAERWRPYNRVKLTPLLAGEAQVGQVYLGERHPGPGKVVRYDGVSVIDVDRAARQVLTSTDRVVPYAKLVLALGSRAFVPAIQGVGLSGVYAFRNFDDAEALLARSMSARRVVVIGGGLLGLEAARGMRRRGAAVTVVEHERRLMPRQLDAEAGDILAGRIRALGVDVVTGERVRSIDGEARVAAVTLGDGRVITADTVIVCTGVRANIQLPAAIGLKVGRGVTVDDELRSSDPDIYAVGECAEHRGTVYGLVGPGIEQAQAAAASIAGTPSRYGGSTPATKLKVLGADVFSIGDFESIEQQPGIRSVVFHAAADNAYRRLFVDRGRLVAALGVGDWPEASRLQEAVARRRPAGPWSLRSFRRTGRLWKPATGGIAAWPREAIVCNCTGVTKGAISDAVTLGAGSLDEVRAATSANSVCGSCTPLLHALLGEPAEPAPVRWWRWLVGLSATAGIAAAAVALLPRIPLADSFQPHELFRSLWLDSVWKQWSGYSLLGLTVAAAVLGLRKRVGWLARLGGYQGWRLAHLCIGVPTVAALVWHTGLRLGSNLNLALVASLLAALAFGAVAGAITGGEHALRDRRSADGTGSLRTLPLWIHILALWPLPALVLAHILAVYTY